MRFLTRSIAALVRLVLLPVRLALWVSALLVRLGFKVGTAPVRVSWWATRRSGLKALLYLAVGVVVGLLVAAVPGRELRRRIIDRVGAGTPGTGDTDPEVGEKVTFELAHAPRTWHLPQPTVEVVEGRVVLRGEVPHRAAVEELERTAAAVAGVTAVSSELVVAAGGVPAGGDDAGTAAAGAV